MRRQLLLVITLLMSPGLAWQATAAVITPEQALAAVRAFEANPTLVLAPPVLESETDGPEWTHSEEYSIDTPDDSQPSKSWTVDGATGEILSVYHGDAYPDTVANPDEPFGPMTQADCRSVALALARSTYFGFDAAGMQVSGEEWTGAGWSFEWVQVLANGARTPNLVFIEVNPSDGRLQKYLAVHCATPASADPTLTPAQALTAAAAYAGISQVESSETPQLYADPDGTYWDVCVSGDDSDGVPLYLRVRINADTGEGISLSSVNSGQQTDVAPRIQPVRKTVPHATNALVPLRSSLAATKLALVRWLGSGVVVVTVARHVYRIRVGRRTATRDGREVTISEAPDLRDGHVSVPAKLVQMMKKDAASPSLREGQRKRSRKKGGGT